MNYNTFEISGDFIANGDSQIVKMPASFNHAELASLRFLDTNGDQITPTAGTFSVKGSADGVNFRNLTNANGNTEIDATTVYSDSISMPAATGLMTHAKIKFTGLVAANAVEIVGLLHRVEA